jgi:hypothetical protein
MRRDAREKSDNRCSVHSGPGPQLGKPSRVARGLLWGAAAHCASCNSSTVASGNGCTFYDVTAGTNAMTCLAGSLKRATSTQSDSFGVVTGYSSTVRGRLPRTRRTRLC